jgi:hypothetical protein
LVISGGGLLDEAVAVGRQKTTVASVEDGFEVCIFE